MHAVLSFQVTHLFVVIRMLVLSLLYHFLMIFELIGMCVTSVTVFIARFIRALTFLSTALAPINLNCRKIFKGPSESGGCGDLLYSGHGVVVSACIIYSWVQTQPRVHWMISLLITIAGFHSMWCSAVERFHYTADMTLAFFMTFFIFFGLAHFTRYFERTSVTSPRPINLRHALFPIALGGAIHAICKAFDFLH
eukprot:m.118000 g.118000  ORF g.118000 m.118000 type:complete len:195 (-) comp13639_c0_seq6:257-841(-)